MTKEIVYFNVGGTQYNVARDTLLLYSNTMLAKMVSEKCTTDQFCRTRYRDDRTFFIDRDAGKFKYILDWYRNGKIVVPKTIALDAMRHEAHFFGLKDAIIEREVEVPRLLRGDLLNDSTNKEVERRRNYNTIKEVERRGTTVEKSRSRRESPLSYL